MVLAFASFFLLVTTEQIFQMTAPASRILACPKSLRSSSIEDLFDLPTNLVSRPRFG
jgi:hypothetical protein